jgi:hypothetical protein
MTFGWRNLQGFGIGKSLLVSLDRGWILVQRSGEVRKIQSFCWRASDYFRGRAFCINYSVVKDQNLYISNTYSNKYEISRKGRINIKRI